MHTTGPDAGRRRRERRRHHSLHALPRRTYPFRVLGMGLAFLPLAVVLWELRAHWLAWAWIVACGLLWPHVAYLLARRSPRPLEAELRNFVVDSAMAGSWVPLMHFNVLPSAVLLAVVSADKFNTGVRGLWLRALPATLVGAGAVALLTGAAAQPYSSMPVVVASLPILIIHTLAVSLGSYKLVRRVQRQNLQLEAVSRTDALTGLSNRRYWEEQAQAMLGRQAASAHGASLLLIDVDRFKGINDRHGHAVGDDVLRAIAAVLRAEVPEDGQCGRLGGDEFVVALPLAPDAAAGVADCLREAVQSLDFPRQPGLRCSLSIGIAPAPEGVLGLREWIEAADRALYRAKDAGRNQLALSPPAPARPLSPAEPAGGPR